MCKIYALQHPFKDRTKKPVKFFVNKWLFFFFTMTFTSSASVIWNLLNLKYSLPDEVSINKH